VTPLPNSPTLEKLPKAAEVRAELRATVDRIAALRKLLRFIERCPECRQPAAQRQEAGHA
jgi:hypothetical protein